MIIGIDFDNTIICYESIFHEVAHELKLIPSSVEKSKTGVRDWLRDCGQEDLWTELQGVVYGKFLARAMPFEGATRSVKKLQESGNTVFIISHKTRHPFLGPQYDLHLAAAQWLSEHFIFDGQILVEQGNIFFNETLEEKIACINKLDCDFFIDDLPELLCSPHFPKKTKKVLFDPLNKHNKLINLCPTKSWDEIYQLIVTS